MQDTTIRDTWTQFVNDEKYKKHFIDNNDKWFGDQKGITACSENMYRRGIQTEEKKKR